MASKPKADTIQPPPPRMDTTPVDVSLDSRFVETIMTGEMCLRGGKTVSSCENGYGGWRKWRIGRRWKEGKRRQEGGLWESEGGMMKKRVFSLPTSSLLTPSPALSLNADTSLLVSSPPGCWLVTTSTVFWTTCQTDTHSTCVCI